MGHPLGRHSRNVIGCCLIPLGICGLKNNSKQITHGIGCVWGMPSLSPLSSPDYDPSIYGIQHAGWRNWLWHFHYFRLEQTKLLYEIFWIPEALLEKLKILLRTSCLTELILDCFSEVQFNHTVCNYHTLIWDLLNSSSFVRETENTVFRNSCLIEPFF